MSPCCLKSGGLGRGASTGLRLWEGLGSQTTNWYTPLVFVLHALSPPTPGNSLLLLPFHLTGIYQIRVGRALRNHANCPHSAPRPPFYCWRKSRRRGGPCAWLHGHLGKSWNESPKLLNQPGVSSNSGCLLLIILSCFILSHLIKD